MNIAHRLIKNCVLGVFNTFFWHFLIVYIYIYIYKAQICIYEYVFVQIVVNLEQMKKAYLKKR